MLKYNSCSNIGELEKVLLLRMILFLLASMFALMLKLTKLLTGDSFKGFRWRKDCEIFPGYKFCSKTDFLCTESRLTFLSM